MKKYILITFMIVSLIITTTFHSTKTVHAIAPVIPLAYILTAMAVGGTAYLGYESMYDSNGNLALEDSPLHEYASNLMLMPDPDDDPENPEDESINDLMGSMSLGQKIGLNAGLGLSQLLLSSGQQMLINSEYVSSSYTPEEQGAFSVTSELTGFNKQAYDLMYNQATIGTTSYSTAILNAFSQGLVIGAYPTALQRTLTLNGTTGGDNKGVTFVVATTATSFQNTNYYYRPDGGSGYGDRYQLRYNSTISNNYFDTYTIFTHYYDDTTETYIPWNTVSSTLQITKGINASENSYVGNSTSRDSLIFPSQISSYFTAPKVFQLPWINSSVRTTQEWASGTVKESPWVVDTDPFLQSPYILPTPPQTNPDSVGNVVRIPTQADIEKYFNDLKQAQDEATRKAIAEAFNNSIYGTSDQVAPEQTTTPDPLSPTNPDPDPDPDPPTEPTTVGSYVLPDSILDRFPFCLPFDFMRLIEKFDNEPVAPKFTWTFDFTSFGGDNEELVIDLSMFNDVAKIVRTLMVIPFIVGLIWATRKLLIV